MLSSCAFFACADFHVLPRCAPMVFPKRQSIWSSVLACAAACLQCSAVAGQAEDFNLESIGARGGFPESGSGRNFNQAELFTDWDLPWNWDLGKELHLRPQVDASVGWLGDGTYAAAIGTIGPRLVLSRERLPVSIVGGTSPTLLSRTVFRDKDFGINFQFTLRIGLDYDFAPHWRLSYHFQHMSDAGLSSKNPALNMHMFGLSYLF